MAALRLPVQALAYLQAALGFIEPVSPVLLAIGGLSGTGKTSLAASLAPMLGPAPGALHLRSDVERKRLFDVAETVPLPAEVYRREVSVTVDRRLIDQAESALHAAQAVIVDATHQRAEDRDAIAAVAARTGVPFFGFWLEAPPDLLMQRVTDRRRDASDATARIVEIQAKETIGALDWRRLNAGRSLAVLTAEVLGFLPIAELHSAKWRHWRLRRGVLDQGDTGPRSDRRDPLGTAGWDSQSRRRKRPRSPGSHIDPDQGTPMPPG